MIRIDQVWLAVEPVYMRSGMDRLLARVIEVFGALMPTRYGCWPLSLRQKERAAWRRKGVLLEDAVDADIAAIEQELINLGGPQPEQKTVSHHSDRGSQDVSIRYSDRLIEAGISPSVGSRGSAYDNTLVETINGLYKTEVTYIRAPWRTKAAEPVLL